MPPKKKGKEKKKEEETAMTVSKDDDKNALSHRLADILTDEQKKLIKNNFAKNATDDELAIYFNFCEKAGLDPLRGQSHFIKYDKNSKPIMMIGIDGFQARATSDPRYNGMVANVVYENDDFSMNPVEGIIAHSFGVKARGKLVGAYAVLKRTGMVTAVQWIDFDEYKMNSKIWKEKPEIMITKVARATLLRREYPDNFSGVYEPAEFSSEISEKGDFIEHKKKEVQQFPNGQSTRQPKVVEPEPEIQDADFKDVEVEPETDDDGYTCTCPEPCTLDGHPKEPEDNAGEIPDDLIEDDMSPREALKAIMDFGWNEMKAGRGELPIKVKKVMIEHYQPWETGKPDVWNIPEPNVIAMVLELTGKKLKKAEKTKKCSDCDIKITEPEAIEQQDDDEKPLCLVCFKKHQESDD